MPYVLRSTWLVAAVAAGAVLAVGGGAAHATVASARSVVKIHATSTGGVVAPASTRPGIAEISNTGDGTIFLVSPRHGASKSALIHDVNAKTPAGMITDFVVADALPDDATVYLRLSRGDYYLLDFDNSTLRAALVATMRVTGTATNATPPAAQPITITSKDKLTSPATMSANSELRIANNSTHLQETFAVRIPKKTSDQALKSLLIKPSFNKIGNVTSAFPTIIALLSAGNSVTRSFHTSAGRYLVFDAELTDQTTEPRLVAERVDLITVH